MVWPLCMPVLSGPPCLVTSTPYSLPSSHSMSIYTVNQCGFILCLTVTVKAVKLCRFCNFHASCPMAVVPNLFSLKTPFPVSKTSQPPPNPNPHTLK